MTAIASNAGAEARTGIVEANAAAIGAVNQPAASPSVARDAFAMIARVWLERAAGESHTPTERRAAIQDSSAPRHA